MSKNALLVFSGFLAFLLYALLLYALLLNRHNQEAQKILLDLGKKDEQIIDLDLEYLPGDEKMANKSEEGDFLEPKDHEESLENIFSSVDNFQEKTDKNIQKNEQDAEQRRLREQQRLRKNQKNQEILKGLQQNLNQFTQKLENIKSKTLDLQVPKQDGVDDKAYQEWYAQIYKILYGGWKGSFYQRASVSVIIVITKDGKFSYTILSYSDFKDYNDSVIALLESLKKIDFPPYPLGHMISIKVNFTTKEEQ
ncbi:energy transducer TonB [Helicobacter cetorum]|uniref:Periplasmic protein TonB n=1 Tax=Helicobacter cetorum (strain ATCC BAA-540 / CCUG 52418 / MIT 99-5656) TaxID=1163745 RepID=I0EU37_HELCM|nr:energy transducer TonB [Helicobacter cetorum]AFI06456.1 hypothetical protein HCD_07325 [Helicobacter cetorum MIT 99-5656]